MLHADDLTLISISMVDLQMQLAALQGFCEQPQLTVNLNKTKVVAFKASKSNCIDFDFNDRVVEQEKSYRCLGLHFHATKSHMVYLTL